MLLPAGTHASNACMVTEFLPSQASVPISIMNPGRGYPIYIGIVQKPAMGDIHFYNDKHLIKIGKPPALLGDSQSLTFRAMKKAS